MNFDPYHYSTNEGRLRENWSSSPSEEMKTERKSLDQEDSLKDELDEEMEFDLDLSDDNI